MKNGLTRDEINSIDNFINGFNKIKTKTTVMNSINDLIEDETLIVPEGFPGEKTMELPCIINNKTKGKAIITTNYIDVTTRDWQEEYIEEYDMKLRQFIKGNVEIYIELKEDDKQFTSGIFEIKIIGFKPFEAYCIVSGKNMYINGKPQDK